MKTCRIFWLVIGKLKPLLAAIPVRLEAEAAGGEGVLGVLGHVGLHQEAGAACISTGSHLPSCLVALVHCFPSDGADYADTIARRRSLPSLPAIASLPKVVAPLLPNHHHGPDHLVEHLLHPGLHLTADQQLHVLVRSLPALTCLEAERHLCFLLWQTFLINWCLGLGVDLLYSNLCGVNRKTNSRGVNTNQGFRKVRSGLSLKLMERMRC